jgi:tetratricopeptide (TPR) repeat protein
MKGVTIHMTLILVLSLMAQVGIAVTPDSLAEKGNQAFGEGQYETAAEYYEQVLDENLESSSLYFNLGNAYYKLNNVAGAILNYEKAKKLDPNDEDIDFNLKLAGMRTVDKIETIPIFFISDWTIDLVNLYSEDTWGWLSMLLVWIGFVILSIYVVAKSSAIKKLFFGVGILFLAMSFVCFGLGNKKYNRLVHDQKAIVFSPSITIKSSPGENGNDLVVLHEGTKVMILDEVGGWNKIRLANGNVGWLPSSSIENI